MRIKPLLSLLFLLTLGGIMNVSLAQTAVTVGSQVTDEANIVSGKAYILQSQAAGTGTVPYINDNGTNYDIPMNSPCNESSVYYLISNGDGTWKIKNYYTNRYWGVPVYNQAIASVADEASAGAWSLNFSNGTAYPSAPDAESTVRGLDRSSNKLWGYSTGTGGTKQVKIFEVALSTTAVFSDFADKDINVSATEAASISEGQWYVMKNRGRNVYAYENNGSMRNQAAAPSGLATENAKFLVRFVDAGSGKYYLQNGLGNYWGAIPQNTPPVRLILRMVTSTLRLRPTASSSIARIPVILWLVGEPAFPLLRGATTTGSSSPSNLWSRGCRLSMRSTRLTT